MRLICTKNEKEAQFLANVRLRDAGKNFRPARRLGLAGLTQISLRSSWHAILSRLKACLLKRVYSISRYSKEETWKWRRSVGWYPSEETKFFFLNGWGSLNGWNMIRPKNKYREKFVLIRMAVNLNHRKVFYMEQIISSVQVWHGISLAMTTSWSWISSNKEDLRRLLCVMFKRR